VSTHILPLKGLFDLAGAESTTELLKWRGSLEVLKGRNDPISDTETLTPLLYVHIYRLILRKLYKKDVVTKRDRPRNKASSL